MPDRHRGGATQTPYHDLSLSGPERTDDDDIAAAISEIYELKKSEISKEDFERVVERCKNGSYTRFRPYLLKSVLKEINDAISAPLIDQSKPSKGNRTPNASKGSKTSSKPKISIVQPTDFNEEEISAEEMEEIKALARKLDQQR